MSFRKIIPVLIAVFIAFGLIFFAVARENTIFSSKKSVGTQKNAELQEGVRILAEEVLKDSADRDDDGDGLKNWEEVFWKTDPNNKDSDGDGVTDDVEVRELQRKASGGGSSREVGVVNAAGETVTVTDEVSRRLFSQYLDLKQSGSLNQSSMENLIYQALASIDVGEVKVYSSASIKTIPDSDTTGAKNYANALVITKEKYRALYNESPIITVGRSLNFEDGSTVESIKRASTLYSLEATELSKLLVPKSLVAAHVALLNNYMTSSEGLGRFADLQADPLIAIAGIQEHAGAAAAEREIMLGIRNFFDARGVIFSPEEAGSRLRNI